MLNSNSSAGLCLAEKSSGVEGPTVCFAWGTPREGVTTASRVVPPSLSHPVSYNTLFGLSPHFLYLL